MVDTNASLPRGIDVSNNQGVIDWDQVATAGLSFAFIKADEGDYFNDTYLHRNWTATKRIGLYRGAYHFANPDRCAAVTSADHFLAAVNAVGLEAGDMLALDLESGTGNLADWTLTFCQRIEAAVGYKPLVYTSPGFIHDHGLASRPELGQYGLWLASWGVPTPPPAPPPWDLVAFHQYQVAPAGTVPGIAGEIDMDAFNGPADRIPLYGKPATSEPPHDYVVGPGLLQKMQAVGDVPASDERFLPLWSEAWGASGTRYVFWKQTGEISLYPPAA